MKSIQTFIDSKQQEFMSHPFFKELEKLDSIEEISYFVPELTFWAMTFQDILRINEEKVTDPYLKKIARHHRLEDAGHDKWFLHDKAYLGKKLNNQCKNDDVAWLYSNETQLTRDAAYSIMSEIYKAEDERVNIALLLTLESSGHVFFEKVVNQVKKTGENENLQYFSSSHLDVEMAHAIFEEEMESKMFAMKIPVDVRRQALQMVERCYVAFNKMFDGLLTALTHRIKVAEENKAANSRYDEEEVGKQEVI